jgi:DNA-directed RNA polymerase specialized sigma24 family protein
MSNYIDNKEFESKIKSYKAGDDAAESIIVSDLYLLSSNIIESFKFKFIEKEDALQECILLSYKKLQNFDPDRGAAFNYFTTMILNHLKQMYTKEKKHQEKVYSYFEHIRENLENQDE